MSFQSLLNKVATLQTRATTVGALGEASIVYSDAGTARCAIEVASQYGGRVDGRDAVRATHNGYFLQSTTIDSSMRVIIDGRTYGVLTVESPRGHHKEVGLVLNSSPQTEP